MRVDERKNFGRRECPGCACAVAANHNRCPICGYEFPHRPAGRRRAIWLAALLMLALWLWLM